MDIRSIISKLENIESMNRVTEADDPAAVIQKYTDMGKKPTPDMPAFIDPKDGKVKYMDQGNSMGGQPQVKTMPSDWIKRYAPDLAAALDAQGGNKQGYGSQEKGGLFGIKGLGNFDQGTKVNTAQAGADQFSAKFKADKLKQLNDLVAKLGAQSKGGNTDPALGKIDYSLAGGTPGGGMGLKLKETLLREFSMEEDVPFNPMAAGSQMAAARAPAPAPAPAPASAAGGDLVAQIEKVMSELVDMGDDPEVAKALQSARTAIDASKKATPAANAAAPGGTQGAAAPGGTQGAAAPGGTQGAASPGAAGGEKGSKPVGPNATTQEKMDRFVYLMNKKKQTASATASASSDAAKSAAVGGQAASPAAAPTKESTDYFINKLRLIESNIINEVLTPEEEKELGVIGPEMVRTQGIDKLPPEVQTAIKDYQASPGGGQAASPAAGGDPKVMALQNALIKAGAQITADGKMGPKTSAAMAQFPDVAKQFPDVKPAAAAGASKNPKLAPLSKILSQIEPILKKAAAPAAAPAGQAASPAAKGPQQMSDPLMQKKAPAGTPPPAGAAPAAGGKTTTTTTNTSVSGTLKMGKPEGPITYNGKVVNPGDPEYGAASQALIAQQGKIQQARSNMGAPKGPASTAPVQQGATNADRRDFEETRNMSEAERYRALVNKLESIDQPEENKEKVDEVAPLVVGGVMAALAAIKGGSDYLDKLATAKKAAGGLKPEEVKQLADLINQMEELMADEETKKAIDADKEMTKRVTDIGNKAKELSGQAAMANQSTAQTIGGTVGAAVKEPFRMVGRGISSAASAVGDFFKGAGSAQQ